jgi:hypothetical protein
MNRYRERSGAAVDSREILLEHHIRQIQQNHRNPINRLGSKTFSQTDEDGITFEILRRLGSLQDGVFIEYGVENGTENNTLCLRALGWRGSWIGGEDLAYPISVPESEFNYKKAWITLDNIVGLTRERFRLLNITNPDFISLDLDGNDIYFVEAILKDGIRPRIFVVEYNAKFIPPIKWKIEYDEKHVWRQDDYFGASLSSFVEMFDGYGYILVCCNSHTGANAFFVPKEYQESFSDVPKDIRELYAPPRYLLPKRFGHVSSIRTISKLF